MASRNLPVQKLKPRLKYSHLLFVPTNTDQKIFFQTNPPSSNPWLGHFTSDFLVQSFSRHDLNVDPDLNKYIK